MTRIVSDFKGLPLTQQHEAYSAITAAYNAAKDARRLELEQEIKQLGFKPGKVKKPPAAVKYRSKANPDKGWAGRGAEPTWLKTEMETTGLPLNAFKVQSPGG